MARRRVASHAGSWYSADEERLSLELDRWLDQVPETSRCIGPLSSQIGSVELPTPGARIIIAPHAGFSYSGPAAAWAYKALDMIKAKRIFVLGPSHHHYLTRCALSQCESYETPLGDLPLDHATMAELQATGQFDYMSQSVDEAEHSIEMHLPYIHKVISRTFSDYITNIPPLIPILVGATNPTTEAAYGALLAPYLADPTSVFIVSSDFAHWGARFRYTYYEPSVPDGTSSVSTSPTGRYLKSNEKPPKDPQIFESIAAVDMRCVGAVESGEHAAFLEVLERTGNTVCGRHPIGVVMAALQVLRDQKLRQGDAVGEDFGKFKFVRYERSSDCVSVKDSSVSYCSGFAVL